MPPLRAIPRPPSSRASSRPRSLLVRRASPQEEALLMTSDLGDPQPEPVTWSPISWIASQATAAADVLTRAGQSIIDTVVADARDLGGLLWAAATGEAPAEPGPAFQFYTGLAESVNRLLPETVQKKLAGKSEDNIAGYVTTSDGRRFPVPKAIDPQSQGEKAQSQAISAALTKAKLDAAATQAKNRLEQQKLELTKDQWNRTFALKERASAQEAELRNLQIRAMELALERETASPAQRALWGRPSTLSPETAETTRRVQAIGPGVPGAIVTTRRRFATE